jgi:hypothetical protein
MLVYICCYNLLQLYSTLWSECKGTMQVNMGMVSPQDIKSWQRSELNLRTRDKDKR